ncbi:unnamed protein product [Pleuronectes platessa]|uniref:Uncharacterized protein n=1 Tax=Pleuronectes platessa TaxID=8262 RepID=A0A9N7UAW1_PLEPL|nr:unnamed protein product [Pleuronectes platessa]
MKAAWRGRAFKPLDLLLLVNDRLREVNESPSSSSLGPDEEQTPMFSPCHCSEPSRAEPRRSGCTVRAETDRDELGPGPQQPMAFIGHWVKDQSQLGCCTEAMM